MTLIKMKRKKLEMNAGENAVRRQLKSHNIKHTFEPHTYEYAVPYTYTPDFIVKTRSGKEFILEVKGYHRGMAVWCAKILHFITQNPDVDFRIVFLNSKKKFNKNYKSTLGDWATRNNIVWSDDGVVPSEWLN